MKSSSYIILVIMFLSTSVFCQSVIIKSFEKDSDGGPSTPVLYNGKYYFTAYENGFGRELWCTDGTVAGTYMVKDIRPGAADGVEPFFELAAHVHNGILYFRADDGVTGTELWRTNGTSAGTFLVKDISVGGSDGNPGQFTTAGNRMYFVSNNSLYKTNGTTNGTTWLKSFNVVTNLYGFNGDLYFSADDNNQGQELWKSTGTTNGTNLLKDLNGVPGTSLPCNFNATNNTLFFMSTGSGGGYELWKTNGTAAGTVLVKDINPTGSGVAVTYADIETYTIGNEIYFRGNDGVNGWQLWKSDGTSAGTIMLSNISGGLYFYEELAFANNKFYFGAFTDTHYSMYDVVTNSVSLTNFPKKSYFNNRKRIFLNNDMYYTDKDTILGSELWKADGTPTGLAPIQETHLLNGWPISTTFSGFASIFGALGDTLLFTHGKSPTSFNVPLFAYNVSNTDTCFSPSVIVPVPIANDKTHFVWNTVDNNSQYQFRYREVGTTNWTTINTDKTYTQVNNLTPNTDYDYQIRTQCGSSWTTWSAVQSYNTSTIGNSNTPHILAEKQEDSTTQRLYWYRSSAINTVQFRYRPFNSNAAWITTGNNNGFKKLNNLIPNTFYEYQYRVNTGGWGNWTSNLYFNTASSSVISNPPIIIPDSINITFKVDMTNVNVNNSVSLKSDIDNFTTDFQLSDIDGDDVWETTLYLPDSAIYQYYFVKDGTNEMLTAANCTVDNNGIFNRQVSVFENDTTLSTVCWESCDSCIILPIVEDSVFVTFQVNMRDESVTDTVFLVGSFNNFQPIAMHDLNNDIIWEVTLLLPDSMDYQYRFFNNNMFETLDSNDFCLINQNAIWYRNSSIYSNDTTLLDVCFGFCDACLLSTGGQSNNLYLAEIYPNPTDKTLFLKNVPSLFHYYIFNTTGQLLQEGENSQTIDVVNLETGNYWIIITFEDEQIRRLQFYKN